MKILCITSALSISDIPEFNKRTSGLGYMVKDIVDSLLLVDDRYQIDILVTHKLNKEYSLGNIKIRGISVGKILGNISFAGLSICFSLIKRYGKDFKSFCHIVYFAILSGYIQYLFKTNKYDIVHIHGCDYANEYVIRVCELLNIPYLVTLHGLNVLGAHTVSPNMEKHEFDFIRNMAQMNSYVSFVSSGSKNRILNYLGLSTRNFSVIPNAFHINKNVNANINIRKEYGLPKEARIILYVGNISLRKNQAGFINAFSQLDANEIKNVYVLFIGRDNPADSISNYIDVSRFKDHFVQCGFVSKGNMFEYYSQADAVALVSKSEGFGLGLIEGFSYGLPGLAVSSMDAIEDLKSDDALVVVEDLTTASIANGIRRLISSLWNKDEIIEHSKKFSMETMGKKYVSLYNTILNATR